MSRPIVLLAVAAVAAFAWVLPAPAPGAEAPADRVVAMYFHRTQRCPTCKLMGAYSEEAVREGFAEQIKGGKVEFHDVDFQDERNARLTRAYGITGPSLIVVKVEGNRVKEYRNLKEMWAKVADKPAFLQYVRENVTAYLP